MLRGTNIYLITMADPAQSAGTTAANSSTPGRLLRNYEYVADLFQERQRCQPQCDHQPYNKPEMNQPRHYDSK